MQTYQSSKSIFVPSYCWQQSLTPFRYMEKRLVLQLNGNRKINGILRGFDPFMNIVLDDTKDEATDTLLGLIV